MNKIQNTNAQKMSEMRLLIFKEIIHLFWNSALFENIDLDTLSKQIRQKYALPDENKAFVNNHIRIAMGLNPSGQQAFTDEIQQVRSMDETSLPVVVALEEVCRHCPADRRSCEEACKYDAFVYTRSQGFKPDTDKCLNCGQCIRKCDFGALSDKIEFVPLLNWLKDDNTAVYAAVAPAIVGQFGDQVSMGQLRTAFKLLGFKDMIEVALFADILTIREAYEFNELVKSEDDFFLTSCCCPVWFNLIKKTYPDLFQHMSPSISPMIASGRFLKKLYPACKVVFISPCIAKKAESKEPDLQGAVDFVLTFSELKSVFEVLDIQLENLHAEEKDQASFGGRIYARAGGVSFSVKSVINRIAPQRIVKLKSRKVNGVLQCREILQKLSTGEKIQANFIEGMGCEGGCIGGPKTNIDKETALRHVNDFGEDSYIMTPFDNLNIHKMLSELGIDGIDNIIVNNELTRLLSR